MRTIHQLRSSESKRTRRRVGLSAAIFGVVSVAVVFGTVTSGLLSADGAPHSTSRPTITHAANAASSANAAPSAHTAADTKAETPSAYSGGHLMTADPSGGYWTVSWAGAITPYDGAPTFGSPAASGMKLAQPIVDMAAAPDGQGYWLPAGGRGSLLCW